MESSTQTKYVLPAMPNDLPAQFKEAENWLQVLGQQLNASNGINAERIELGDHCSALKDTDDELELYGIREADIKQKLLGCQVNMSAVTGVEKVLKHARLLTTKVKIGDLQQALMLHVVDFLQHPLTDKLLHQVTPEDLATAVNVLRAVFGAS